MKNLFFFLLTSFLIHFNLSPTQAQTFPAKPNVLVVTAHPDDDALFSATIFKIAKLVGGTVDLALLTNGEGGYNYSILAEPIYGKELTREDIGRPYLPAIRKKELMEGGAVVGYRNYFFLEQKDNYKTLDVQNIFDEIWDVNRAKEDLRRILKGEDYDFVFTLLPHSETHAHHKGSAILALEVLDEMNPAKRPTVLGATIFTKNAERGILFSGLDGFPITTISETAPKFHIDRTQAFGHLKRLNYKIIGNWVIAAHKSQGTMQMLMNRGDIEEFYFYKLNDESRIPMMEAFFDFLAKVNVGEPLPNTNN